MFLEFLQTPEGVLSAICLFFLLIALIAFRSTRWLVLAMAIFISAIAPPRAGHQTGYNYLPLFLTLSAIGRGVILALLAVMILPVLQSHRAWRNRVFLLGTIFFFAFELVYSVRLMFAGDFIRGYLAIFSYMLIWIVIAWGLARSIHSMDDLRNLLRSIAFAGIIYNIAVLVQYLANPGSVIINSRLAGISGNPQHAAAVFAACIPASLYFMLQPTERKWWRIVVAANSALMLLFLLWTGSRTGALITLVALAAMFRLRIGKFFLAAILMLILVVLGLQFFGEDLSIAGRLMDTTDTRSAAWRRLLSDFTSNPILGVPVEEYSYSENSYLLAASRTGVVGLLPLLAAVLLILAAMLRANRARRLLGPDAFLVQTVLAGLLSLGVGAFFEGYLAGVFSPMVLVIYIYLAALAFLIDYIENPMACMAASPGLEVVYDDEGRPFIPVVQQAPAP